MENREIKFRAWDAHNKLMIDPYCELKGTRFWGEDLTNGVYVTPVDVMQFTGLHDKNGKEIYEGDIVISEFDSYRYNKNVMKRTMVVEHDTVNPCFVLIDVYDPNITEYDFVQCGMRTNEVIGNIHENPELIKQQ